MFFKDRREAGLLLAEKLKKYRGENVIVYALPRGGVVIAVEIARFLQVPLDLIITRKIGHPQNAEFAVAATAENGDMITNPQVFSVDERWLQEAAKKEQKEAKRRRESYLEGRKELSAKGKIALLVDDGIATGLTIRVGIKELLHKHPKKIIVAVPIIPEETYAMLKQLVDEVIALEIPADDEFMGAVGAYYENFPAVEDQEVIFTLQNYKQ